MADTDHRVGDLQQIPSDGWALPPGVSGKIRDGAEHDDLATRASAPEKVDGRRDGPHRRLLIVAHEGGAVRRGDRAHAP
jgi:hypothetical protein